MNRTTSSGTRPLVPASRLDAILAAIDTGLQTAGDTAYGDDWPTPRAPHRVAHPLAAADHRRMRRNRSHQRKEQHQMTASDFLHCDELLDDYRTEGMNFVRDDTGVWYARSNVRGAGFTEARWWRVTGAIPDDLDGAIEVARELMEATP